MTDNTTIIVSFGLTYADLPTPTLTGFSFGGWYTADSGVGTKIESTTKVAITAAQTLYAKWTQNSYRVNFVYQDGSTANTSTDVTFATYYGTALPAPTRTGYTFAGWNIAADGSGTKIETTTLVSTAGEHTLYAQWTAISYRVTFDYQDSVTTKTYKDVTYDSAYGDLPTPTARTGYVFDAWYTTSTGGTKVYSGDTVKITAAQTLYAHWTASTYTVTFSYQDGSTIDLTKTATYDGTYGFLPLPAPTRTGYAFQGWYTAATGGANVKSTDTVKITAPQTLYAQWKANTFLIVYKKNDGTTASTTANITYDALYNSLPTITRTGYTLDGWYTAATGGTEVTSSMTVKATADVVLYAHWTPVTYTVTFDYQGGVTGIDNKPATFASTYGALPAPTKEGYTFKGWYTTTTGTTKIITSTSVTITADQTLYAQWTPIAYTVTYDYNGGNPSTSYILVGFGSSYGTLVTATRAGYTLDGWYTAATGGTPVTSATIVTTASDHTIYAHWTGKPYLVTFSYQDGATTNTTLNVTCGSAYGDLPVPTRVGYTFKGWCSNISGGVEYTSDKTVESPNDVALYAQWKIIAYTTSFAANGGSSVTEITNDYNTEIGSQPVSTRTGYALEGWYTEATLTNKISFPYTVTVNATLYANWTIQSYTLIYSVNGGTGTLPVGNTSYYYGSPVTVLGNTGGITKTGYTFAGWNTVYDGSGTSYSADDTFSMPAATVRLYAKWTINSYSVSYDGNSNTGGTAPGASTMVYNALATVKANTGSLVRTGYTFDGWNTKSDGTGTTSYTGSGAGTFTMGAANVTLYAKWTVIKYTVTYSKNAIETATVPAAVTDSYGASVATGAAATDEAYHFIEWNTAENGSGTTYAPGALFNMPAYDMTIYAIWVPNKYTVTFDGNGNSGGTVPATAEVAYNATTNLPDGLQL